MWEALRLEVGFRQKRFGLCYRMWTHAVHYIMLRTTKTWALKVSEEQLFCNKIRLYHEVFLQELQLYSCKFIPRIALFWYTKSSFPLPTISSNCLHVWFYDRIHVLLSNPRTTLGISVRFLPYVLFQRCSSWSGTNITLKIILAHLSMCPFISLRVQ